MNIKSRLGDGAQEITGAADAGGQLHCVTERGDVSKVDCIQRHAGFLGILCQVQSVQYMCPVSCCVIADVQVNGGPF